MEGGGEGVVAVGEVEWSGEVLCVWGLAVEGTVGACRERRFGRAENCNLEWMVIMVSIVSGRTRDIAYPERFKTSRRCGEVAVGDGFDDRRCKAGFSRHCELIDLIVGSVEKDHGIPKLSLKLAVLHIVGTELGLSIRTPPNVTNF